MEILLTLAVKFWQWTVLISLIIIGLAKTIFDKNKMVKIFLSIFIKIIYI